VIGDAKTKKASTRSLVIVENASSKFSTVAAGTMTSWATTEAAVKAFQQAKGIAVDGIVGRVTWINIDEADQSEPVLKIGSTGLPVRRAQKRMSLVGFEVGGVDGRYGTQTEAAVKQLQQQAGINVDGVVGPQTWSVIDALESEGPVS
jgi:peptidoglycan hydrolase-like protein with peptidoglycan-binding domain